MNPTPAARSDAFPSFDGTRIHYRAWGEPPDPGTPTVVLHHGFLVDTHVNWVASGVLDALLRRGHHVVGIDARGHGRSAKPHHPDRYGEPTMARDLGTLLDVLRLVRVTLVGYSMGAVVALLAAARDRRIERLVVGGVGAAVVEQGGVDARVLRPQALVAGFEADDPSRLDRRVAGLRTWVEKLGGDPRALAAQARMAHRGPTPLDALRVPTLVVCGTEDPLAQRPEVLAGAISGARLLTLPGDHRSVVRHPGFAAGIADFVTERPAR